MTDMAYMKHISNRMTEYIKIAFYREHSDVRIQGYRSGVHGEGAGLRVWRVRGENVTYPRELI